MVAAVLVQYHVGKASVTNSISPWVLPSTIRPEEGGVTVLYLVLKQLLDSVSLIWGQSTKNHMHSMLSTLEIICVDTECARCIFYPPITPKM